MLQLLVHRPWQRPVATANLQRGGDAGFALVSVLWTLTILSLLAALMLSASRSSSRTERGLWQQDEMDAAFQAAIARAVLGILDNRPDHRWPIDGRPVEFVFDDFKMQISVQDESGKIDINAAPVELLTGLLQSTGLSNGQAQNIANDIIDWRENDELHHLHNTDFDTTAVKPGLYSPRHGAFQSVAELQVVPGITPTIFAKIKPGLTVYSHRPAFDASTAPLATLLALPGMDTAKARAIIRNRSDTNSGQALQPSLPPLSMSGRAFTISAHMTYRGHMIDCTAIIRLTANPGKPYWALIAE